MPLPVIDLIGLPSDSNSSFERGPALAPAAIRAALWSDRGNLACENGMEIGQDFELADRGDLPLREAREVFEARGLIEPYVASMAATNATPDKVAQLRHHLEQELVSGTAGGVAGAAFFLTQYGKLYLQVVQYLHK